MDDEVEMMKVDGTWVMWRYKLCKERCQWRYLLSVEEGHVLEWSSTKQTVERLLYQRRLNCKSVTYTLFLDSVWYHADRSISKRESFWRCFIQRRHDCSCHNQIIHSQWSKQLEIARGVIVVCAQLYIHSFLPWRVYDKTGTSLASWAIGQWLYFLPLMSLLWPFSFCFEQHCDRVECCG